nr:MAG TPA: hypothetical protein [Inoviridae sp.]
MLTGFALGSCLMLLCNYLIKKHGEKFRPGDEEICKKCQFKDAVMSTLACDDTNVND